MVAARRVSREGVLRARQRREPDQAHEALHALGQDGVLALAGEPVPAVPARRRLLAATFAAASGAETLAVARRHLRVDPAHVRQSRRPRRGAERAHQARLSGQLTADRDARGHDRHNYDARPLSGAACTPRAPIDTLGGAERRASPHDSRLSRSYHLLRSARMMRSALAMYC